MTIHNFKVIYLTLFLYSFPISPSTLLGTMRHVHGFKGYTYPPMTPATSRNHSCTCLLILRPGGCLDIFHEWNYRLACCVGPKSSRWWSLLEAGFPLSGQHKSQQFIFTVRCTRTITPPPSSASHFFLELSDTPGQNHAQSPVVSAHVWSVSVYKYSPQRQQ